MKHDPQDPRITAYVFNELEDAERTAFEEALASSPELQQAVEETRSVLSVLEAEFGDQPPQTMSAEQRSQVEQAIADSSQSRAAPAPPPVSVSNNGDSAGANAASKNAPTPLSRSGEGRGRMWATIAIVEAAALAVGGVIVLANNMQPPSTTSPTAMHAPSAAVTQEEEGSAFANSDRSDMGMGDASPRAEGSTRSDDDGSVRSNFNGSPKPPQPEPGEKKSPSPPPTDAPSATSPSHTLSPQNSSQPSPASRSGSQSTVASQVGKAAQSGEGQSNGGQPGSRQSGQAGSGQAGSAQGRSKRSSDGRGFSSGPGGAQAGDGQAYGGNGLAGAGSGSAAGAPGYGGAPAPSVPGLPPGSNQAGAGNRGGVLYRQQAGGQGQPGGLSLAGAAPGSGGGAPGGSAGYGANTKGFAGGGLGGGMGGMGPGGSLGGIGGGGGGAPLAFNGPTGGGIPLADQSGFVAGDSFGLDQGMGPGRGGDRFERIVENEFLSPWDSPYSTFSIDVDTASYSKMRMYLSRNQMPRPDAVRIEELINYFPYAYEPPSSDESAPPFAARMAVSECPWNANHRIVRVGVKGKEMANDQRPASNLVFLLDVSGSMTAANKLPLLVRGMQMLTEQLNENDSVAIVVYAGKAGMVLEPTHGDDKQTILESLKRLRAGGSTNGGAGIKLAYKTAMDNFIKDGVNRVILCTDGDFNVGVTGNDALVRLAEENSKDGVFLSVLGFGMGNHNDSMLEKISNKGNGNYAFIDTETEARKVLVEQMSGTLVTIAKDVKIQVEFNPERVAAYRLIGYENRILATEDFNDDTKDAGEIGAGHAVTALYEIVPKEVEEQPELSEVDPLKYQRPRKLTKEAQADELLTLKMRYKKPTEDKSTKLEFPLKNKVLKFGEVDPDFRFTAAVASFGMLLRGSKFAGDASYDAVLEIATEAAKDDEVGYRTEFLELVKKAKAISGQ